MNVKHPTIRQGLSDKQDSLNLQKECSNDLSYFAG